jgi:hypothetical protein
MLVYKITAGFKTSIVGLGVECSTAVLLTLASSMLKTEDNF